MATCVTYWRWEFFVDIVYNHEVTLEDEAEVTRMRVCHDTDAGTA